MRKILSLCGLHECIMLTFAWVLQLLHLSWGCLDAVDITFYHIVDKRHYTQQTPTVYSMHAHWFIQPSESFEHLVD